MKILIVPTVREIYKGQFEKCVDIKLINFIKKTFKNSSIDIYSLKNKNNYDLIILAGGNNSIFLNKADKIRNRINNLIYKFAIKKKIKIIGICHGAHFLAKKLGFILRKKNNHQETIKYKKKSNINIFGIAEDNTVEAFHFKNKKILGLMWHPERYDKIKLFDKKLIKEFHATNSIVGR